MDMCIVMTEKISNAHIQHNNPCRTAPRSRKLKKGRNYVRYPFFKPGCYNKNDYAYTKNLDGGVDIKPLGFSQKTQSFSSSARVDSLTTHGISTNEILRRVFSNIFEGNIKRIKVTDPYGDVIFVGAIYILTAYKKTSSMLDTVVHKGNSSCLLAHYPFQKKQLCS